MNWYYAKNGAQQGPISLEDMKSRIAMGEIGDSDLAWREGMSDWMPVGTIAELKPAPPAPAEDRGFAAPASSTPAYAPTSSPAQSPAATQEPYRSPAAAPAQGVQPMAHAQAPSQGLAIASLICGILSLIGCCAWFLMIPLGLVAIILGVIALSKAKGDPARYSGKGMATTDVYKRQSKGSPRRRECGGTVTRTPKAGCGDRDCIAGDSGEHGAAAQALA